MNDELVDPLQSTESELNQIITFLEDLKKIVPHLPSEEYMEEIKDLRDDTCRLRAEYSVLYVKLLEAATR